MKFYIAGKFSRQQEFKVVRNKLEEAGHKVTSRWLDEVSPDVITDYFQETTAAIDLEDISSAHAMIFFSEEPPSPPRGGRHVEFGYALAERLPIYVIGPKENVFHYTPDYFGIVRHFKTLEEVIDAVAH
jgi:hypothetical protein